MTITKEVLLANARNGGRRRGIAGRARNDGKGEGIAGQARNDGISGLSGLG